MAKIQTESELIKVTAYHEAGHAVVGWHYRQWIRERGISCDMNEPGNGLAHLRSEFPIPLSKLPEPIRNAAKKRLQAQCHIDLAGFAAELCATRRRGRLFRGADGRSALQQIMTVMECDEEQAMWRFSFIEIEVKKLVRRRKMWAGIELIARSLLSSQSLFLDSDSANNLLESSGVPQVAHEYWLK